MLSIAFNFYMVLKRCWIVVTFQLVGFLVLVEFEQGRDVIVSLSIGDSSARHALFAMLGVLWWSWQSWRAARAELHLSEFKFRQMSTRFALRAQVLVPRILGLTPLLLMVLSFYRATGWEQPMIFVYLSMMVWMYVFFRFRYLINAWLKAKLGGYTRHLPDYIHIKNESYPAAFLWAKQGRWLVFRMVWIIVVFVLVLIEPIDFPQYVGSAGLVLFSLGAWQVMATIVDFAERHLHVPLTFLLISCFIFFSLINNNHGIRTTDTLPERQRIADHFDRWLLQQPKQDTTTVILVAAQGGGLRSAYWTAAVLDRLRDSIPGFDQRTYAFSAVSGGSLGVATYTDSAWGDSASLRRRLGRDFLSPVTAALILPEVLQRFLPFPVPSWDRARSLERAWEEACNAPDGGRMAADFVQGYASDPRLLLFHATHVESGMGALISNARVDSSVFEGKLDVMRIIGRDIRLSTAVGISSRFPFLTPPAQVRTEDGVWGHLVDGGYRDNYGGESMLQLYSYLKKRGERMGRPLRFRLLFIENVLFEPEARVSIMYELTAPLISFNRVWSDNGRYTEKSSQLSHLPAEDEVIFIKLERHSEQLIPLGWHLSEAALDRIDMQIGVQTRPAIEKLRSILP